MTLFRKIFFLLTASERKSAVALLGLMLIGMILEMLGIGMVIPAMMLLMRSDLASKYPAYNHVLHLLGSPTQSQLVVGGLLGIACMYLFKTLFLGALAWRQSKFAFGVQAQLSQRIFSAYLRQPYTFHLQRNSAQLVNCAINDVNQFTFSGMLPGMLVLTEGLALIGISALLLSIEPIGTAILVVVLGGASWAFHHFTRNRITRWGAARQRHEGLRVQHMQQGLGAAKDVILLGREPEFLAQYGVHNEECARVGNLQQATQQFLRLWLELLAVVSLVILVFTMMAQGKGTAVILPALGLFAAAAFRLMPSVNRVLGAMQSLRFGLAVVNTIHSELQLAVPSVRRDDRFQGDVFRSEIALCAIGFTYPAAAAPAIRDVSLVIRKGESVGFVGTSGSGKSTLVDVLLGLLEPQIGSVKVDGQDIRLHIRAWQDRIGYVPQSIYLTDDTLRRNIAFGLAEGQIDDSAVARAIKAAQLEELVAALPNGLESVVGERGVRLSGGQRQRIGIARALYNNPAVLVLDEATSALDIVTEQEVMQAVMALQRSKTILIVAHRLSTLEKCDRLYRLENGRVSEERAMAFQGPVVPTASANGA